ncbi:protein-glutamate O-methyltransferase CheR [Maridesulfovibrio ferrireducens]|uniref:CheR family methyltransferase n=1 Tax=Maridesulfovibrio ferrireducens TaxID=246191 RepID=UPI001A252F60|nr:protein-glutamate O-methyltransferase CheR [Maridesulfovibrio ferrireducens]MBI9111391.1 protein-glutamate O-methyltransferase CheR [Maridesulfovibrio ferrireducens]
MAGLFSNSGFSGGIKITTLEFTQLRDIIYELFGIFLNDNRKYLMENRFSARITELKLKSFKEYIDYLKYDRNKNLELNKLADLITTNETSFFRDNPQLTAFTNESLMEVLEAKRKTGRRELRIWSAGCSSGEEPYTLSIIIHEILKTELPKWRIQITASDISSSVIAQAKKGEYTKYALKTTNAAIAKKYFTEKDAGFFQVKPEIKRLVRFDKINLNDPVALKKVPKSDIIFCRNVIIYFDKEMKKRVLRAFYDNLVDDGHLYVGHSESLHTITNTFKAKHHTGAISYRKV